MPQDSARPEFWDERYRGGVTPWDAAGVPPLLEAWLAAQSRALRVLVPGCGSGYEVRAFADRGHEVLAIDFSDAAIQAARRVLGAHAERVRKGDFFGFEGDATPFDLVYERAFLCALPRRLWPRWAARCAALLAAGGALAGFFYFDDNLRGPPFGIARTELEALLAPAFALAEDVAVAPAQSIPVFQGKERWMLWRRTPRPSAL